MFAQVRLRLLGFRYLSKKIRRKQILVWGSAVTRAILSKIMNSFPYLKNIFSLFLVMALCTLMLGRILWQSNKELDASTVWISHSYAVISEAEKPPVLLEEMLANQRAYLLTEQRVFYNQYAANKKDFIKSLDHLESLTQDNPAQFEKIQKMRTLFKAFSSRLEQRASRYKGQFFLFRKDVSTTLSALHRDQRALAKLNQQALENERSLLKDRISLLEQRKQSYYRILLFGGGGMAALMFLFNTLIFYSQSRRVMAEESLKEYMNDLERSNEELEEFSHLVSHDLKEPLRGICTLSAFLLEDYKDKLDAQGVEKIQRLIYISRRMEQLIKDLLYFSEIGRSKLAVQEADPNAMVDEIRLMLESLLKERNASISVLKPLPHITCDKVRMTEVFRNLITNAVKYNDKPEKLVEVGFLETADTQQGQKKNVFYVKDNGNGIPLEHHDDIFRIFKRLQNAAENERAGTGVGLTFVKKIIEYCGGSIWLESKPQEGTVFYFTLNNAE